ncbi:hypothetical protein N7478_000620 [Penicillium angulare]|uniref:uncharacterized protein n=1 Tax=Penicillium angulare TaxID=116970 RepID=UPI0025424272|nr:uncharacterized protein N7478_000620 [Penicillium angulare]KAJ5291369.1 hypothetical protein N7478_000620 [Penicillium angulare]
MVVERAARLPAVRSASQNNHLSLTLLRVGGDRPGINPDEKRALVFFQSWTVPSLTGYFDSRLWTDLVLPMCHAEPAVSHAVVALSSLHEDLEIRGAPLSRENLSLAHHRFALGQYGRSLGVLNERRNSQDPKYRDIILTCCLLFVAFEFMRGQYQLALSHLKQGLSIIEEARSSDDGLPISANMETVEKSLQAAMARLETHCVFFGLDPVAKLGQAPTDWSLIIFSTVLEARRSFDKVLAQTVRFFSATYKLPLKERLPILHPELVEMQIKASFQMSQYLRQFDNSALHPHGKKEERGLNLIRLHHLQFSIILQTVLSDDDRFVFINYLEEFKRIVAFCKGISNSFAEESPTGTRPKLLSDVGILPSLLLVGWKCHEFPVRQQALALLEAWPHREGIWDSRLLAIFLKQLLHIELETIQASGDPQAPMRISTTRCLKLDQNERTATLHYETGNCGEYGPQSKVILFDEDIQ